MNEVNKIILGIDPGTARMGWGIIEFDGNNYTALGYGTLETSPQTDEHLRLGELYEKLNLLTKKYNPQIIAVEDIFYFKNQKTLINVSQARGIVLLLAANTHKKYYSFTPLQIKMAVTGYGKAEKKQVQHMVKILLNLKKEPKLDDSADALAVAICCANSISILGMQRSS